MDLLGSFFIVEVSASGQTNTFNPWLITLSYLVATICCYCIFSLSAKLVNERNISLKKYWHFGGALAIGVGIWSTHFIIMLAVETDMRTRYDISIAFISLITAITLGYCLLHIIKNSSTTLRKRFGLSLVLGVGFVLVHYIGVSALIFDGEIRHLAVFFLLSLMIAVCIAIALLLTTTKLLHHKTTYKTALTVASSLALGSLLCVVY